jgi:hypothetical protein
LENPWPFNSFRNFAPIRPSTATGIHIGPPARLEGGENVQGDIVHVG